MVLGTNDQSPRILQGMSERFYTCGPLFPGPVELEGPEAHHLAAVCRVRPGDEVILFNGDGRQYPARVTDVGRKRVTVEVIGFDRTYREVGFPVIVAAPLPKGDRGQFLIEKLTELGVTSFVPLSTERSVVHPRETRIEKLERHVIEASKQCGRNVLMKIEPLVKWETFCRRPDLPSCKIVAHPRGDAELSFAGAATGVALAVGPEGGFTDDEVLGLGWNAGWREANLGLRILRVETAAIVLVCKTLTATGPRVLDTGSVCDDGSCPAEWPRT